MARFWIVVEVASQHIACERCDEWLTSKARRGKPCKRTRRLAEELDQEMNSASEPTAQLREREPDPEDDDVRRPTSAVDDSSDSEIVSALIFRREEEAAAADRLADRRRRALRAARQPRQQEERQQRV